MREPHHFREEKRQNIKNPHAKKREEKSVVDE